MMVKASTRPELQYEYVVETFVCGVAKMPARVEKVEIAN
jgi:hypothetical protein